jgi:hypothetical protein
MRISEPKYGQLLGMEDERRMIMASIKAPPASRMFLSSEIPATSIERIVYDILVRLRIRFQFQYNWMENKLTSYPEAAKVPDFILPDLQDSVIETYGSYWHSGTADIQADQIKQARAAMMGYTVINRGITTSPNVGATGAKYVIWWEDDILIGGIDFLIDRDFPELLSGNLRSDPDPYLLDNKSEFQRMVSLEKARLKRQLRPAPPSQSRPTAPPRFKRAGKKATQPGLSQEPWYATTKGRVPPPGEPLAPI